MFTVYSISHWLLSTFHEYAGPRDTDMNIVDMVSILLKFSEWCEVTVTSSNSPGIKVSLELFNLKVIFYVCMCLCV